MSDELVKRLRSANDESFVETLYGEAADRIEQLTAEREALEQNNHRWKMECENFWRDREKDLNELLDEALAEWSNYSSAWVTAEGKLEDAVQGLEKCQAELDEYSRQEYPLDHTVHERYRQRDYNANPARITLAALKGESHD